MFSPISVASVFWLLDLTVVDLSPSFDPFARYQFKSLQGAAKIRSNLIRLFIHLQATSAVQRKVTRSPSWRPFITTVCRRLWRLYAGFAARIRFAHSDAS